jgi:hypothetical protein
MAAAEIRLRIHIIDSVITSEDRGGVSIRRRDNIDGVNLVYPAVTAIIFTILHVFQDVNKIFGGEV